MENQAVDPKVVERIRKTLNLSRDGGATENEAAVAADLAQKLMRKYNLTLAEVEAGGGAGTEGTKRTKQEHKGKAQYEFQQQLMVDCAEVNFCVVLKQTEWRNKREFTTGFQLIGREVNVAAARELFAYLNATTERLAFEYVGSDNKLRLSRAAVSFKTGCAERLGERLRERHQEAMREQAREARERNAASRHPGAQPGTGLAVVLTDFAQEEAERNNDVRWNLPEGTTTKTRLRNELLSAVYQAAYNALTRDVPADVEAMTAVASRAAFDTAAAGQLAKAEVDKQVRWAVDTRMHMAAQAAKEARETPAQRAKKEEQQARENARYWQRQANEQRAREDRVDYSAYSAGTRAGDEVGLDKQVKDAPTPRKLA